MIGDALDIRGRLKRLMPAWFGADQGETPILDGVLTGPAVALAWAHELYAYARLQTRILTATEGWLDLVALDFFGGDFVRNDGQSDASFRAGIIAQLFRPRATRAAVSLAIETLTGTIPIIFECERAADTGGFDVGGCGYDIAGGWGATDMTAQAFVIVKRPTPAGIPDVSGFDQPFGGFDTASPFEWSEAADPQGVVDAAIYRALDRVRPVGVTLWVHIRDNLEEFAIVGGGSAFLGGALYSDGAQHYQPPVVI